MTDDYDDIINLPHHVSAVYKPMPLLSRAAQFAPFAALTGYDEAIAEAARFTDTQVCLDENARELLDRKLALLREHIDCRPQLTVTYFVADKKKCGGRYCTLTGKLTKVDDVRRVLVLDSRIEISLQDVLDVSSSLLQL